MQTQEMPVPRAGRLVFGGSFNPVHRGHVAIVQHVLSAGICDSVVLVPAGQSPFKKGEDYAPAAVRLEMLGAAVAELPEESISRLHISDTEIRRPGPSYTADTLREFDDGIHTGLLIGADSLESFHDWREADWILHRFPLYAVRRAGSAPSSVRKWIARLEGFFPLAKIHLLSFVPPDCSSTQVREDLARGVGYAELQSCLPQSVFSIASGRRIYRRESESGPAYR